MNLRHWTISCLILWPASMAMAQMHQIDPAKLPQDPKVQHAYSSVLPVEPFVRAWSNTWKHPVPKKQVVNTLNASLNDLKPALQAAPQNEELWLLQGLVARFGYNVDVDGSYDLAVSSLEHAAKVAPADYRAEWFLGIHKCQTREMKAGMEQLLAVEEKFPWQKLPIDFWDDYATCGTVSLMPAHTLRAVDRAIRLGAPRSKYTSMLEMAQTRSKPSDEKASYDAAEVWQSTTGKAESRFTSQLCGIAFTLRHDWQVGPTGFSNGTCAMPFQSGPYPSKAGKNAPSMVILTRRAKLGETLEQFAQSLVDAQAAQVRPAEALPCPVTKCLAWEITDKTMYQNQDGGRALVVAFAATQPEYAGLALEVPFDPPVAQSSKTQFFRPTQRLRRMNGTLYSFFMFDASAAIFEKAREDFRFLLASIRVD